MCANINSPSRSKSLKQIFLHKSPTVQQLREDIRKQFKDKLILGRANELSKRRQLYTTIIADVQRRYSITNPSLVDDGSETLNTEEILQLLVEVEQEFYQKVSEQQAEEHVLDLEKETNALLEQFVICSVCNKLVHFEGNSSTIICDECAQLHFSNENL